MKGGDRVRPVQRTLSYVPEHQSQASSLPETWSSDSAVPCRAGGLHGKAVLQHVLTIPSRRGSIWPYLILIAIPAAAFIVPDAWGGHMLMTGDNLQQNYPLHVLVGHLIQHGHLPFWDPDIFSGTPLLADFNAGAFYPLDGLFAVLPDRVAWIALEVILFSGIGIGMYTFLHALALSTAASLLASVTFMCSGVVLGQVNHVDMTEGFVALPWMLLAVHHIVRNGRWRWSIMLGVGLALVILGGAPEAMLDESLIVVMYTVASTGRSWSSWWRVITRVGAGAVLGLSLAAIQWLPGLNAIANSQRNSLGGSFAASGSYPRKDLFLGLAPYLYGGFGRLGERTFSSHYNLPELSIYVGILPVIGLFTLMRPSWPSRLVRRERLTWYVVGGVMLVFALGAYTPLEHVFNFIPLYGHQRLQSRNMIGVSTAMCVLFAGWLDRAPEEEPDMVAYDRWVGFVPAVVVLGLVVWAFAAPDEFIRFLPETNPSPTLVHTIREASVVALAFSVVAGLVVVVRHHLRPALWLTLASVFALVDIGFVAGTGQLTYTPSNAVLSGSSPTEHALAIRLAPGARFDMFDPQSYSPDPYGDNGLTDYNILANLPSVGGYASIVSATYNKATETHAGGDLNISALQSGQLRGLDLQEFLTVPEYFMIPVTSPTASGTRSTEIPESRGIDPALPNGFSPLYNDSDYPANPPARPTLKAGKTDAWFLGEVAHPDHAVLSFGEPSATAVLRMGIITTANVTVWGQPFLLASGSRSVVAPLPAGDAVGVVAQVIFGRIPAHQISVHIGHQYYELNGSLSAALRPGPWKWQAAVGDLALFGITHHQAQVHTEDRTPASVRVLSNDVNTETIRVRADRPTTLIRGVAWDNGWDAQVSVNGGRATGVADTESGLVQAVRVPAGDVIVTFRYRPPHLYVATALTGAGLLFLLVVGVISLLRRRKPVRADQQKG